MEPIVVRPRILGSIVVVVVVCLILLPAAVVAPVGGQIVCGVIVMSALAIVVVRARRRITVDDGGIERLGVVRTVRIAWDDVTYYTFWTAQPGAINQKPGVCAINVRGRDGRRIVVDHRWRQPTAAVLRVIAVIHPRLRSTTLDVEPFSFAEGGPRHKKREIAYGEIEKVVVSADQIGVRQVGKTVSWVMVDIKHVTNGLLFLESLADRGVKVLAGGGQFLPPESIQAFANSRLG